MSHQELSFETLAVHAGREDLSVLGVHALPLDLSSTYPLSDLVRGGESLELMAMGGQDKSNPVYSRLYNPTVGRFEEALAKLEGADEAVAFASGMAAMTACLLAAKQKGGHVVAVRPLYGGSDHLIASGLLGLDVTWAEPDGVHAALRSDTALVIVETPGNQTLALLDIEAVVAQACGVPVLVDSTFATPVLQNPLKLGASLVLHSATKFLGGHGDVLRVAAQVFGWIRMLPTASISPVCPGRISVVASIWQTTAGPAMRLPAASLVRS